MNLHTLSKEGPMRRLSSLFSRHTQSAPPVKHDRASTMQETVSAPKPEPRRCLNEGGHKSSR
jgi:hypothetical protein